MSNTQCLTTLSPPCNNINIYSNTTCSIGSYCCDYSYKTLEITNGNTTYIYKYDYSCNYSIPNQLALIQCGKCYTITTLITFDTYNETLQNHCNLNNLTCVDNTIGKYINPETCYYPKSDLTQLTTHIPENEYNKKETANSYRLAFNIFISLFALSGLIIRLLRDSESIKKRVFPGLFASYYIERRERNINIINNI
jgi:hypothetical protein